MIDFKKYPILGILVYGLLLISCLLELSVELGIHEFDDFASHHGLAIFALGSLFANWDDLSKALKNFKNQKNKEAPKEPLWFYQFKLYFKFAKQRGERFGK